MMKRVIESQFLASLEEFPVTAIVGPRQVGKTTLVKEWGKDKDIVHLDLEKNSDLSKLDDPECFLEGVASKTVVLDEIQHKPELFPLLRSLIDDDRRPGRFVILGSASPNLQRQSTESLAGRINYLGMFPLNLLEAKGSLDWKQLWVRGGFPEPALSKNPDFPQKWHQNFIRSYTKRDLPMYGLSAHPVFVTQLFKMIAGQNGSLLNCNTLAKDLGIKSGLVQTYVDFLSESFLVIKLPPWHKSVRKQLVKSPKLYLRDSGMLHHFRGIRDYDILLKETIAGNSWEGFVIAQIASVLESDDDMYHYRAEDGAEIDLLVRRNDRWLLAAEIKLTNTPSLKRGTYLAMQDLDLKHLYVVTPSAKTRPLPENITIIGLEDILYKIAQK